MISTYLRVLLGGTAAGLLADRGYPWREPDVFN